jgi:hypothetical protein
MGWQRFGVRDNMPLWVSSVLGLLASIALSQTVLAASASNDALEKFEGQMLRLGISGGASDVSCADWVAASTAYQAYLSSNPDAAEAKQVSGQEPNIPEVTTLADAQNQVEQHFDQMNKMRTSNGLSSLSPSDGSDSFQPFVIVVCTDTSHPAVPHTLAFAAYVAFTLAAGDTGPFMALNAPPPPASPPQPSPPQDTGANDPNQGRIDKSFPGTPLTFGERSAILDKIRQCWFVDGVAEGVESMSVLLKVETDATGTVSGVQIAGADVGRYESDPVFAGFADRARRALLDYRCSALPLPPSLVGQPHTFTMRVSP